MSDSNPSRPWRKAVGPAYVLLAIASAGFALIGPLPLLLGLTLAVGGASLASLLRVALPRPFRSLALLPALVGLGVIAAYSPLGTLPELLAGLAGLALLLWCSEDPDRYAGAVGRGLAALLVPGAAFGIAWTSSLLLPSGLGSVGLAAALLVMSATAVILLLRAPGVFDRDPAVTS